MEVRLLLERFRSRAALKSAFIVQLSGASVAQCVSRLEAEGINPQTRAKVLPTAVWHFRQLL